MQYKFVNEPDLTISQITLDRILTGDILINHVDENTKWEGNPPSPKEMLDALERAREAGYSNGYDDCDSREEY